MNQHRISGGTRNPTSWENLRAASEGYSPEDIERIKSRARVAGYRFGALVMLLAIIFWVLVISIFLGWPW